MSLRSIRVLLVTAMLVALAMVVIAAGSVGASDRAIRAAHILVAPDHDPAAAAELPPADPAWTDAQQAADAIATELRAIPDAGERAARFAELARTRSDDPGSAEQGGELGWFTREQMVAEFADPLFDASGLAPGDIVGPVRTPFGWHVILFEEEGPESSVAPWESPPPPTPATTLRTTGAEPRVRLAHAPAVGATATIELIARSTVSVQVGDAEPVDSTATTTITWVATVSEGDTPGTTRITVAFPSVATDGVRTPFGTLLGGAPVIEVGNGTSAESAPGDVADLDPVIDQAIVAALVALGAQPELVPAEPVGVGAAWTSTLATTDPSVEPEATLVRQLDTTVTALDGTSVTTTTHMTSETGPGTIRLPDADAALNVTKESATATSDSTATFDLSSLDLRSETQGTSQVALTVDDGTRQGPMTVDSTTTATVTVKPASPSGPQKDSGGSGWRPMRPRSERPATLAWGSMRYPPDAYNPFW